MTNGKRTKQALDALLLLLDSNRDRAAVKFENVRRRLIFYFLWRGCSTPEDLVDRTVDRVSGKLVEGVEIENVEAFWFGVARMVLKEHWTARGKQPASIVDLPKDREPSIDPAMRERDREAARFEEDKNECMRACLQRLPENDRNLMIAYCGGEDKEQVAISQGAKLPNLRVKVHRLRTKLRKCLDDCISDRMKFSVGFKHS